ncbi:porin [Halotalea alkalilenta]|uniref:Porin domain-containing protein n=1 Tax=Halotalea alkalilenta TaxID=376489 RepID=A0A172YJ54_9GAMM|nr:porin [Halotalea alkalilenta]ANF59258.1 hypothetical protein A5892_18840 [Halotalea alkalilenta]
MHNATSHARHTFKLSLLAVAIGAASFSAIEQASAFTAYEDANNRFIINGRIAGNYTWNRGGVDGEDNFKNQASRINLVYEHYFADDWTALARTEWGFDPFFENGDDNHTKRHQYVGVKHPVYGTVLLGQQWSIYYDMVGIMTDQLWVYGAEAQGSFNGNMGNGFQGLSRPNQSISYRNTWDDLTWGLMYGTSTGENKSDLVGFDSVTGNPEYVSRGGERRYFAQTALSWKASEDLTLAAAYNYSRIEQHYVTSDAGQVTEDPNVNAWLLGASWTPGNWYLAVTAGEQRNLRGQGNGAYQSARGYEGVARYTFPELTSFGDVQLYSAVNRYEDKDTSQRASYYVLGTALVAFDSKLILALEHRFNDNKTASGSNTTADKDSTALLVRYNY